MQLLTSVAATAAVLASTVTAANFTGDVLNGVPVIHDLNLADVPAQKVSKYYLRVGEINGGHPVHIPVMVARGTPESLETGKKLSISAAIHGDELNPVRVVQRIFEQLEGEVATLNGTGMYTSRSSSWSWKANSYSDRYTHCQPNGNLPQPAQLLHSRRIRLPHQCEPRFPWRVCRARWQWTQHPCLQHLELCLGQHISSRRWH